MWQAWSAVSFVDDARHETTQAPLAVAVTRTLLLEDGEFTEIGVIGLREHVHANVWTRAAPVIITPKTSNYFHFARFAPRRLVPLKSVLLDTFLHTPVRSAHGFVAACAGACVWALSQMFASRHGPSSC